MALQLVIGNKNYSSWSMRPAVLMNQLEIAYHELKLRLPNPGDTVFPAQIARFSPAGRVPVLVDDGFAVWDSLAIVEYLHEKFPERGVWPADPKRRARARSIAAEMHTGFPVLRDRCTMNIEAYFPEIGRRLWAEHADLRREVARIEAAWAAALQSSGGPFLFGAFSAADAFFAPVAVRFTRFELPVADTSRAYAERVLAAPGVARWVTEALAEHDYIAIDEPYRTAR